MPCCRGHVQPCGVSGEGRTDVDPAGVKAICEQGWLSAQSCFLKRPEAGWEGARGGRQRCCAPRLRAGEALGLGWRSPLPPGPARHPLRPGTQEAPSRVQSGPHHLQALSCCVCWVKPQGQGHLFPSGSEYSTGAYSGQQRPALGQWAAGDRTHTHTVSGVGLQQDPNLVEPPDPCCPAWP